ncbi:MAG: hypothetical protein IKE36_04660 [Solobacterium sp.]|nr:hypothetical protein [Solobacterium sp.]
MTIYLFVLNLCMTGLAEICSRHYCGMTDHFRTLDLCRPCFLVVLYHLVLCTLPVMPEDTLVLFFPFLYLAAVTDLRCGEIPDLCSIGLLVLSSPKGLHMQIYILTVILCVILSFLGLMGWGDTKIILAWSISYSRYFFIALACACLLALCNSAGKLKKRQEIRFAPYLTAGFLFVMLFCRR